MHLLFVRGLSISGKLPLVVFYQIVYNLDLENDRVPSLRSDISPAKRPSDNIPK